MARKSIKKWKTLICKHCGKAFFVPQYELNYRPNIKFCSPNCYHLSTRKPTEYRPCAYCGKEIAITTTNKQKKFCDTKCACAYKRARDRKPTVGVGGYKYVWFADGSGQKEHRYIMEQKLGRKLKRNEVVHHIDGDRTNNDISNLIVMSRGEHSALHRREELERGKKLFGGVQSGNQ